MIPGHECIQGVRTIKSKVAIPMHYSYASGGAPQRFASLVKADAQVVVLGQA